MITKGRKTTRNDTMEPVPTITEKEPKHKQIIRITRNHSMIKPVQEQEISKCIL